MLSIAIDSFNPLQCLGSPANFQQVANGLFQAEGSITARIRGMKITPHLSLGQALSPESISLFVRLWHAVGKAGTLSLVLSANNR